MYFCGAHSNRYLDLWIWGGVLLGWTSHITGGFLMLCLHVLLVCTVLTYQLYNIFYLPIVTVFVLWLQEAYVPLSQLSK